MKGKGIYNVATGVETPRIQVTLATAIPESVCREINLGYLDPATVDADDWRTHEKDGWLVVPRAGELLFRVADSGMADLAMYQPLSLEGKVAVVIGGTSASGVPWHSDSRPRALTLIPCSRRLDAADPVAREIEQCGRRSLRLSVDVTSRESLVEARDSVLASFGQIDILVNSADASSALLRSTFPKRSGMPRSRPISPGPCALARSSHRLCSHSPGAGL